MTAANARAIMNVQMVLILEEFIILLQPFPVVPIPFLLDDGNEGKVPQ